MKFQYTLLCAVLFDGKKQKVFLRNKVSDGFDGLEKWRISGVAIK